MLPVILSPTAREELRKILDESEISNPAAAQRLAEAFEQRFEMLGGLPGMGRVREDLGPGVRSVVVRPYVVFFRATETEVGISRILHGKRDVDRIMREELDAE